MRLAVVIFFFSFTSFSQREVLILGNHSSLCIDENDTFIIRDTLPDSLENYDAIMLFSGSTSSLTESDIDRIVNFVELGGGLYSGSENWPLQAESNQVTHRLYKKESFGQFEQLEAEASQNRGNLKFDGIAEIPAGSTTVAFPMDHRLKA